MPTNGPETRQIQPTEPTGIEEVDEFLRSLVNIFQIAVGQSLRSVYLIGSYACGAPAPDSDLDCCFIWAEGTDRNQAERNGTERNRAEQNATKRNETQRNAKFRKVSQ